MDATENEARKDERETRKAAQEDIEARWKMIKNDHEVALKEWTAKCDRLKSEGVHMKDLPAKPKQALKPKCPHRSWIQTRREIYPVRHRRVIAKSNVPTCVQTDHFGCLRALSRVYLIAFEHVAIKYFKNGL